MSDEPGVAGEQQGGVVPRLRAVIEAKDAQLAMLEARLDAVLARLETALAGQEASRERERRAGA